MHSLSEFIDAEDMLKSLHKITHPQQHAERKSNILHPTIDWSTYPPSAFIRCSQTFANEERSKEKQEQEDENEDEEEREQQEEQKQSKNEKQPQLDQQKKQQQHSSVEQTPIACKHLNTKNKKGSSRLMADSTKAHSTGDMKSSLESESSSSGSGVMKKVVRSRSNPQNDVYVKTLTSNKSVRCERRGSGPAYVGRMHGNDVYDRYHIPIRDQSKRLSR